MDKKLNHSVPPIFEGEDGKRRLIDALQGQRFVNGNADLAAAVADVGKPRMVPAKTQIIVQGEYTTSLFAILSGSFDIIINGRKIRQRHGNTSVGEMSAIHPTQPRSATVQAVEDSIVVEINEPDLASLGNRFPSVWKAFAKDLAVRLYERNGLLRKPSDEPRVLIISSTEALPIARAIQSAFEHDPYLVYPWSDGVFTIANYPLEDLERELDRSDFAIAIASEDDVTTSRGKKKRSPRDNVIFEIGYFMGRLGRHRAVLLEPKGAKVKLPSDFDGLKPIPYDYSPGPDMIPKLAPTCNKLRTMFSELGPLT